MKKLAILYGMALTGLVTGFDLAAQAEDTNNPSWLTRPLSMADALNVALEQNATIREAKNDLEAQHGLVIQTRAVALPSVRATGQYTDEELSLIQNFPFSAGTNSGGNSQGFNLPHQNWNSGIQIVQNIYMGGRMVAAIKAATAT